ncbi:hypothetical protein RRF57_005794 [Xylaria bambusicola]|uniref:Oxysterol-binding protein n=1 Tax=Xylaria bambusicola TaxID=326684 RepID=A0AAN7UYI7_9PEZI
MTYSSGSAGDVEDDTTVMEPDQGNGSSFQSSRHKTPIETLRALTTWPSPHPHHLTAPARRRSESRRASHLHSRAAEHVGTNYQARLDATRLIWRLSATHSFMCHPEMLLGIPDMEDPVDRFVSVVKFYLSGWHIRPPGVKKPLNPILGEVYSCYWDLPDNKRAYYISEQTSHHPPKSSYFYMAPDHHIRIDGTLKPRSKFLGNSVARDKIQKEERDSMSQFTILMELTDLLTPLTSWLTQPNMYARGILFGNMKYELGDRSVVRCPELGLTADIDFKVKGWVGGTYNAIGGNIKDEKTGQILFEISGLWSEEMFVKDLRNGKKEMFFDARKMKPSKPKVRPIEEQQEHESPRLWQKVARAVKDKNHEVATDEKTKIEDMQREEAAKRAAAGVDWHPKLFRPVKPDIDGHDEDMEKLEWIFKATIDGATPQKQAKQIMDIYPILKGQVTHEEIIPPHHTPPNTTKPHINDNNSRDLIDFGQNDGPIPAQISSSTTTGKHPSTDISNMLESTGQKANGPLLDFSGDLKENLPSEKASVPQAKRADTQESNDDFFDAEE